MKKLLLISGALLAFTASTALAAGQIHLAMSDCGANGAAGLPSNACNTNTGAIVLVGSVISPIDAPQFVAMEGIVDVAQGALLSDYWRADAAGCRNGRITGNFDFTGGPFSCADPFAGLAVGSLFYSYPGAGSTLIPANSARMDIYCALDANFPVPLTAGTEYYMFKITISKTGTVGGCAGCQTPTSLYFNSLLVGQSPNAPGGSQDLTGDGSGQGFSYVGGNISTPTKNTSWGSIKALYR